MSYESTKPSYYDGSGTKFNFEVKNVEILSTPASGGSNIQFPYFPYKIEVKK
ncbi:hypothetical protein [Litchfieldia alkalitelluris]|uniref:hypothetical protein n=1 Tax=Litchfieldia alkalitelluris TaxID=304268 RepID=UPI00147314FE|nr:hypothetical protein [Litchfieldia alkalitelluris]